MYKKLSQEQYRTDERYANIFFVVQLRPRPMPGKAELHPMLDHFAPQCPRVGVYSAAYTQS